MAALLEMRGITKIFGETTANDKVDFSCGEGCVVALLGENGAGKSTLMNVAYGMHRPDGGEVWFGGRRVRLQSPKDAIRLGIQMVHQHFMLVDDLTVAENAVMGREPHKFGIYQKKEAEKRILALGEAYGLAVEPGRLVGELSVGAKQRAEIVKALYHGAKLLILDEPTAVLTPQEADDLFRVVERLRADGKAVIIITHKLRETMAIADEVFVMRQGRMIGRVRKEDTTPEQLSEMMVGRQLQAPRKERRDPGKTALSLSNVRLADSRGVKVLDGLTLRVRGGEIYGVAGVEGNGQRELLEVACGIITGWSGDVEVLGQDIRKKSVRDIIAMGVSCIHSDRHERGLLLELDAQRNVLLGYQRDQSMLTKFGLLDGRKLAERSEDIFRQYSITPADTHLPSGSFSGGNQQKLIVGREFLRAPRLALVAYPTRGVDIGVSETIHNSILRLKEEGCAVLLITSDLDELYALSDRIGVLYEGRIGMEKDAEQFGPLELGRYMGGGGGDAGKVS